MTEPVQIGTKELLQVIGELHVKVRFLEEQIAARDARIAELTPKPEPAKADG